MLVVDAWNNTRLIEDYDNCIKTRGKDNKNILLLWNDNEVGKEHKALNEEEIIGIVIKRYVLACEIEGKKPRVHDTECVIRNTLREVNKVLDKENDYENR